MPTSRLSLEWTTDAGRLRAFEPTADEVAAAADRLAAFYNEPYNRSMLTNELEMSARDVVEYWAELRAGGGRPFLLERNGAIAGDADYRHIHAGSAEFAIMVGERAAQGRGLGLRFGLMLHVAGFGPLGLERVYAAIIPANLASQRMFQKLGYEPDSSAAARTFAEGDDLTFSLARERFQALHGAAAAGVVVRAGWSGTAGS